MTGPRWNGYGRSPYPGVLRGITAAGKRSPVPRWLELMLAGATLAVIAVMLWQWFACEGTFVRTLFWFRCLP